MTDLIAWDIVLWFVVYLVIGVFVASSKRCAEVRERSISIDRDISVILFVQVYAWPVWAIAIVIQYFKR